MNANCIKGNCYSGKGTFVFNDGSQYIGEFNKNKVHGKGIMYYVNGNKYLGTWENNEKEGKGKFVFVSGSYYIGEFHNDMMNGRGEFYYSNGDVYKGWMSENNAEGLGEYIFTNGETYRGEFSKGRFNGWGIFKYSTGAEYAGTWKNSQREGIGIYKDARGKERKGKWKKDKYLSILSGQEFLSWQKELDPFYSKENQVKPIALAPVGKTKIWAVIIGISSYEHMPQLKYTDDDAYRLYAFLKSPEGGALPDEQIEILIDDHATKKHILHSIEETFSKADANDMVLLYLSGHGLKGAFIPYDFDGTGNKLFYNELNGLLTRSKAKHKLCLADACHSGSYLQARGKIDNMVSDYYEKFNQIQASTAFFLSSRPEQISLEYPSLRQGVFSHFLMKGLKGTADSNQDKVVTVSELYRYVYNQVKSFTKNRQTPVLSGKFDEDMPLAMVR